MKVYVVKLKVTSYHIARATVTSLLATLILMSLADTVIVHGETWVAGEFYVGSVITISARGSGLVLKLLEGFNNMTGYNIKFKEVIKPSGDLLRALADGSICIAFTIAPSLERFYADENMVEWRGPFAYNYFVVIGPSEDPAGVKGSTSVFEAFRRIFDAGERGLTRFISRGDLSGTHVREMLIWDSIGLNPEGKPWYVKAFRGPHETVVMTADLSAYTLVDETTFRMMKSRGQIRDLEILYLGSDPILLNIHSIVTSRHAKCSNEETKKLIESMVNYILGPGQDLIARVYAQQGLYYPISGEMRDVIFKAWEELAKPRGVGVSTPMLSTIEPIPIVLIRSIYISSIAALLAFTLGLVISFLINSMSRHLSNIILGVFDALVGVPTTAVALAVYMLIYPAGPLGFLGLLYTPAAIVIGQMLVTLPLATTYLYRLLASVVSDIRELVLSLSAPSTKIYILVLREISPALVSIYLIVFSRAVGELGVALILGGAIEGVTNVMTTAIAQQVAIGNYGYAITLGGILVLITTGISLFIRTLGDLLWR